MKLLLYVYKCGNCGTEFKTPGISGIVYGELLLRSATGYVAYLDAIEDSHFKEISNIIKNNKYKVLKKNDTVFASVLHDIYGYACDTAPDGSQYQLDRKPACVKCGSDSNLSWAPTQPHESIDNIPIVTYNKWNMLNPIEKQNLIDKSIEKYFERKNEDIK